MPLVASDGHRLGTMCVGGKQPRDMEGHMVRRWRAGGCLLYPDFFRTSLLMLTWATAASVSDRQTARIVRSCEAKTPTAGHHRIGPVRFAMERKCSR